MHMRYGHIIDELSRPAGNNIYITIITLPLPAAVDRLESL